MSFDDFMKKKESNENSYDSVFNELADKLMIHVQNKMHDGYVTTLGDSLHLNKKEVYIKYCHVTEVYNFLMTHRNSDRKTVLDAIQLKIDDADKYLREAYKKQMTKLVEEHNTSGIRSYTFEWLVQDKIGLVSFRMNDGKSVVMQTYIDYYYNEKGRLMMKKINPTKLDKELAS